jgi:hypothetical protein
MPVTRLEIADHVRPAFALGSATRQTLVDAAIGSQARSAAQADSADPSLALLETIEVAP